MKRTLLFSIAIFAFTAEFVWSDTFGIGINQFTIDFVTISGDASSANGTNISGVSSEHDWYKVFLDPDVFRISKFEITNSQWATFEAESNIQLGSSHWTGDNIPVGQRNWFMAAQFVNWLNTSKGYHSAYNFENEEFTLWSAEESTNDNLYRHKDAFYFLPTEHEWVKAAYWNGTEIQTYATKPNESLHQGDGLSETGWNYYNDGYATNPEGPWDVGSGSEEFNGTFDMMGNFWEWLESPFYPGDYMFNSLRGIRGGSFAYWNEIISSDYRGYKHYPQYENIDIGFRVASVIPEPCTLLLLGFGTLALRRKMRR